MRGKEMNRLLKAAPILSLVFVLCFGLSAAFFEVDVFAESAGEEEVDSGEDGYEESDFDEVDGLDEPDGGENPVDLYYESKDTGTVLIVDDRESLFSDSQTRSFIESAGGVLKYANVCVATASEEGYEAYAKDLVDYYFGNGTDSTLFLINMNPRRIYIFSEGQTKKVLDKGAALSITDNIYRQASMGAYYECAEKALAQEATLLSGGRIFEPMKYIGNFFLAFTIALLLSFGLTFWLAPEVKKEAIAGIDEALLAAISAGILFNLVNEERIYDPESSSDSSGGSSGGGGDSGAGGGHSF